uniref:Solute carrier family 22 member 6 n=1 Tax=Sphaeramia orbicularis TaxID=375764 RepID=A0A672YJU4_9TELE
MCYLLETVFPILQLLKHSLCLSFSAHWKCSMMKFDSVLAEVNGFGRFQLQLIFFLVIPRLTLPSHFLLNNFIAAIPQHHCNISFLDDGSIWGNLSTAGRVIVTIPAKDDGTPSSCKMFSEPQYHLLHNYTNITDIPTVPCQNGWVYNNSTFKSTLATEWDLVCDDRKLSRATVTIFFIGVMLGAGVFGHLSDRLGRKRTLLLAYVTTTVFGFASAFSQHFALFVVMRFFTGVGLSGISIITIVLCIEWVDIKHRTAVGILLSLDWSIFSAMLPVVAYYVNDWRNLIITTTSPLCLAIICWWWIPDSARWLISNGKVDSAHFYLTKCAQVNGREQFMADLKPEVLSKVILVENGNRKYSYLDLLKTPRMRRLALLTAIVWFGVAFPYYGIIFSISGFGINIYLTQFIYGAIEIPAKGFAFFTVNKVGRRLSQTSYLVLTGLCIFCNIFIPQGAFRTAVASLGKMFSESSFTCVFLYTTELYPTVLRQNGLGFCSIMARTGTSIAPLIIHLEEFWVHLPSTIFCLVAFIAGLSASFLSETKNIRLPETIEDVEQTRYEGRMLN